MPRLPAQNLPQMYGLSWSDIVSGVATAYCSNFTVRSSTASLLVDMGYRYIEKSGSAWELVLPETYQCLSCKLAVSSHFGDRAINCVGRLCEFCGETLCESIGTSTRTKYKVSYMLNSEIVEDLRARDLPNRICLLL
ncbi:MAG TPA: hypothetical protein VLG40_04945, partial [Candidatus Saccharimonas sp.]|nr:hypothetical protein [Candidatus Saccharimonas sp.]